MAFYIDLTVMRIAAGDVGMLRRDGAASLSLFFFLCGIRSCKGTKQGGINLSLSHSRFLFFILTRFLSHSHSRFLSLSLSLSLSPPPPSF